MAQGRDTPAEARRKQREAQRTLLQWYQRAHAEFGGPCYALNNAYWEIIEISSPHAATATRGRMLFLEREKEVQVMLQNGIQLLPHDRQRKWHYLGGLRVARVACGAKRTVVVTDDGEIFAWGANSAANSVRRRTGASRRRRPRASKSKSKRRSRSKSPRRGGQWRRHAGRGGGGRGPRCSRCAEPAAAAPARVRRGAQRVRALRGIARVCARARARTHTVVWRRGGGGDMLGARFCFLVFSGIKSKGPYRLHVKR